MARKRNAIMPIEWERILDGLPENFRAQREISCARERVPVHLWHDGRTVEEDSMPIYATYIIPNDKATRRRVRGLVDDCGVEFLSIDQETMTRPCTVTVRAPSREALDNLSAKLNAEPEDLREE